MIDAFLESWELATGLFRDGFLALLAAAVVLPPLGMLLSLRRMPFVAVAVPALAGGGVAMAHCAWPLLIPAAVLGSELPPPPAAAQNLGAALLLVLGFVWLARRSRNERGLEGASAILFVVAVALSELLLSESPYEEHADQWLHHGRVLSVLPDGVLRVVGAALVFGGSGFLLRRELWLAALDRDEAELAGLPPVRWLLVTLALIGGVSAFHVPELGPDVVLALLLLPATMLAPAVSSLARLATACALAGLVAALLAFPIAIARDWPVSPSVAVALLGVAAAVRLWRRLVERRGAAGPGGASARREVGTDPR